MCRIFRLTTLFRLDTRRGRDTDQALSGLGVTLAPGAVDGVALAGQAMLAEKQ